jgi:hypothetical protein
MDSVQQWILFSPFSFFYHPIFIIIKLFFLLRILKYHDWIMFKKKKSILYTPSQSNMQLHEKLIYLQGPTNIIAATAFSFTYINFGTYMNQNEVYYTYSNNPKKKLTPTHCSLYKKVWLYFLNQRLTYLIFYLSVPKRIIKNLA